MTVQELITELEYLPLDAEVLIAYQPAWPFEAYLSGVVVSGDTNNDEPIVYLVQGDQKGYLPEEVKNEIGW